jgi:hypothetical protein
MCVVCISGCLVSVWIPCNYPVLVVMRTVFFWDMTPCYWAMTFWHFEGTWCLCLQWPQGQGQMKHFRQVLSLNTILLRHVCIQLMLCISIFNDIFPVWTHDFSHMQICDCVGVCLFLENVLARQILWLPENSNCCFLSPCWVSEHD